MAPRRFIWRCWPWGVGPGDEVIVPALSFVATVNPVRYVGATPVFADVDPDTMSLSRATVEAVLSPRTKAVILTHLFGFAGEAAALQQLAEEKGFFLIEDAAEALGTELAGQHVGTFGRIGCFSFNGNKTLTTGSGGMLVSHDSTLVNRVRARSTQDRVTGSPEIEHGSVGYNYRMNRLASRPGFKPIARIAPAAGQTPGNRQPVCRGPGSL